MIEVQQLSLLRGGKTLLENASVRLYSGDSVALIGANGSGKSSLFSLILGQLDADRGSVKLPSDWRIAHMAQEVSASERAAVDFVIDGHREFRAVEAELENCSDDHRLAELHGQLDNLRAYAIPSQAEQLLLGLGFGTDDLHKPVRAFSGGWRIRLNLAQALMCPSELLLLDEPTNHLDLDATVWLEQWLQAYPGTLLLISHDRDFIDAVCDQVLHLHDAQLDHYRGNYSAFERQRAERLSQQQQAYEKQQAEIAHMEQFIRRFKAKATKARQAQSRIKALERMTMIAPAHVDSPFNFKFPDAPRGSDPLLALDRADLGYASPVLRGINLNIHPGTRLGLLGANGAGKSTLLKTLGGYLPVLGGARRGGDNLALGYFSQHQLESLDLNASPQTQLQRLAPEAREQEILNFLGGFNFRGEMASGSCRYFSGGEKARLALAIIVWQKPNLLLLDEPTNHLDLDMCHALTVALQDFEGAVVLVSHDRHLLRNTVDDFLLVHDGATEPYNGDLDDYRRWLMSRDKTDKPDTDKPPSSPVDKKRARQEAAAARAQLAPLRKEVKALERRMETTQKALGELENKLSDSELYSDNESERLQALLKEQAALREALAADEEQWLALQEQLEEG